MKKKLNLLNDLAARLSEALPKNFHSFKKDLEKNFQRVLKSTLAKFDLITREEFDAQTKVLLRTRKKLEALEAAMEKLEKKASKKKS